MPDAIDTDYSRSRAVLLGTWQYAHLAPTGDAVKNSFYRMKSLLTSPVCRWPTDRVETIINERKPGDLPFRLAELFADVDGTALFYFVGHGQQDSQDKLCMGLVESRDEVQYRGATSLQFSAVWNALYHCSASTKIIIMDCCFAGLAARDAATLGDSFDVASMADCEGTYSIAASGEYGWARFEQDSDKVAQPQTHFTRCLVDLLERGMPGKPEALSFNVIFPQLRRQMRAAKLPEPTQRNTKSAGDFAFARNTARRHPRFLAGVADAPIDLSAEQQTPGADTVPTPTAATPVEYVEQLEDLMRAKGHSFRSLEARTYVHGDTLSSHTTKDEFTIAGTRNRLPNRPTVQMFLRACFCDRKDLPTSLDEDALPPSREMCACQHEDVDAWLVRYDEIANRGLSVTEHAAALWRRYRTWRSGNAGWTTTPGGRGYKPRASGATLRCSFLVMYGSRRAAAAALAELLQRDRHDAAAVVSEEIWPVPARAASVIRQLADDDPAAAEKLFAAVADFSPDKARRLFEKAGVPVPPKETSQ